MERISAYRKIIWKISLWIEGSWTEFTDIAGLFDWVIFSNSTATMRAINE